MTTTGLFNLLCACNFVGLEREGARREKKKKKPKRNGMDWTVEETQNCVCVGGGGMGEEERKADKKTDDGLPQWNTYPTYPTLPPTPSLPPAARLD